MLMENLKLKLAVGLGAVGSLIGALPAGAQTLWNASDTEAVITPAIDAFTANALYVFQTIIPYAVAVGLAVMAGWFFVSLMRRAGRS